MNSSELICRIGEVFTSSRPVNSELFLPADSYEGEDELFYNSDWQNLMPDQLELRTFILNYFTPAGFCYFLPAYLVASLKLGDSGLTDSIIDRLLPPKNDTSRTSFQSWWSLLTAEQQQAIVHTLHYHANNGRIDNLPALRALEEVVSPD